MLKFKKKYSKKMKSQRKDIQRDFWETFIIFLNILILFFEIQLIQNIQKQ